MTGYKELTALIGDNKTHFPHGACPLMSKWQLMQGTIGRVIDAQQQVTFLPMPCLGEHCALWDKPTNGCGLRF